MAYVRQTYKTITNPETGKREFSICKQLFNKLVGLEPQITSPRYLVLAEKLGLLQKYKDKEVFLRDASVAEINELLDAN